MPIKKHIIKVGKDNTIQLPKSLCAAMGVGEDMPIRLYSNNNGYQCTLEVPLSYENISMLEQVKAENVLLRNRIKELEQNGNV